MDGPIIEQIITNRPYTGIADFMNKCPLNKSAMISLIKAGAFDKIETKHGKEFNIEPRIFVMVYYLSKVCEAKKKLTLQNFNGLLQHDLVPQELDFQKRTFAFNKYLKSNCKIGKYYQFDSPCEKFYNDYFNLEELDVINGITCILQTKWDKIYQGVMDGAREWLKENQQQVLKEYNTMLFKEYWDKYAQGNISSWEMEALCFYYHDHELKNVNKQKYGLVNFNDLSPEPDIDYFFKRNNKEIPIYKIYKIAGTVINKNDTRSSITLLTTDGVVAVKFSKEYFAMAARQISERQEDGTKKVVEKGWMTRGTKLLVQGFRREDMFIAKTYAKTNGHQLYKILNINDKGDLILTHERKEGE